MNLTEYAKQTGIKGFTLAFAVAANEKCNPMWGGQTKLDDKNIIKQIDEFKKQRG